MAKRGLGLILDLPSPEEIRKKRFRKGGDMPAGGDEAEAVDNPDEEASTEEEHGLMKEFFEAGNDGDWEAACGFLREYVNKYT